MATRKKISSLLNRLPIIYSLLLFILVISLVSFYLHRSYTQSNAFIQNQNASIASLSASLDSLGIQLHNLEQSDERLRNNELEQKIKQTNLVFLKAQKTYEELNDSKVLLKKIELDNAFAAVLSDLSKLDYASAESKLVKLEKDIDASITASNALKGIDVSALTLDSNPPSQGYRRQKVNVDNKEFVVDIVVGDLSSTRVVVDTASKETCRDNCPVLPLGNYAARNNAWAAINGSYFCPSTYPSCVGKTNSFDLLVMNKDKVYFNSDNNVYSNNPAVIFLGSSVRFVSRALEWGRDTSIDSMLSNFPLLVMNNETKFGGNDDSKMTNRSNRAFVASKGNTVYIGVVRGSTVTESARVLKTLGMENAMNLDSGGSTALYVNGGYKVGPGRDIPNAILFIRK